MRFGSLVACAALPLAANADGSWTEGASKLLQSVFSLQPHRFWVGDDKETATERVEDQLKKTVKSTRAATKKVTSTTLSKAISSLSRATKNLRGASSSAQVTSASLTREEYVQVFLGLANGFGLTMAHKCVQDSETFEKDVSQAIFYFEKRTETDVKKGLAGLAGSFENKDSSNLALSYAVSFCEC